jgi:hypothetical protein
MTHHNAKKILNLFNKTIKIGKENLLTNTNGRNGSYAFLNGREQCIRLAPKTFNCDIKFNDVYFDVTETFQSGLGKTWDDYTNDIPKMKKKKYKEWYSTICNHNKEIYNYGDKLSLEILNKKEYSPKFAYEQGLFQLSFIVSGFYYEEQGCKSLGEFVDKLTKHQNNDELKKLITISAEEYWID